jgi:small GTP-binding protein
LGLGAILSTLDWENVRGEVDRESRARIVLIGASGAGKSTLLNTLKGTLVSMPTGAVGPGDDLRLEDYGLFAVVDVPEHSPNGQLLDGDTTALMLNGADLIVWVLDGLAGLRAWEHEWICRVRAMSRPLLLVLNKVDQIGNDQATTLSHLLAAPVIAISARDSDSVTTRLLPQIVDASPNLATALGREVPAWRRIAAQRVIRRSTALSGLVGIEPAPFLDIPFQVLIQLRLVLRLAAIYGEVVGDRYSRELIATAVSGVALRYVGQQVAKVVPIVGWFASGALAAGGTYTIGQIATEYFEHGREVPTWHWPTQPNWRDKVRGVWQRLKYDPRINTNRHEGERQVTNGQVDRDGGPSTGGATAASGVADHE